MNNSEIKSSLLGCMHQPLSCEWDRSQEGRLHLIQNQSRGKFKFNQHSCCHPDLGLPSIEPCVSARRRRRGGLSGWCCLSCPQIGFTDFNPNKEPWCWEDEDKNKRDEEQKKWIKEQLPGRWSRSARRHHVPLGEASRDAVAHSELLSIRQGGEGGWSRDPARLSQ